MGTVASSKTAPLKGPPRQDCLYCDCTGRGGLLIRPCPNTWLVPYWPRQRCDGVACRSWEGKDVCWTSERGGWGLVGVRVYLPSALWLGQSQYLIEGSQQPRGLAGEAKAFLHRRDGALEVAGDHELCQLQQTVAQDEELPEGGRGHSDAVGRGTGRQWGDRGAGRQRWGWGRRKSKAMRGARNRDGETVRETYTQEERVRESQEQEER